MLVVGGLAQAQQVPDAGSLLREQTKPALPISPPRPIAVPGAVEATPAKPAEGTRFRVKGFRILQATLFTQEQLQAPLADLVGKELGFGELQQASARLMELYQKHGYVARVFLPAQAIQDGVVEIVVVEGVAGSILLQGESQRLDKARIQRLVENQQAVGDVIRVDHIATAVAILNEQPGLGVKSSLKAGAQDGLTDLVIQLEEKPLLSYSLQANNQGSESTGELQLGGNLSLSNPTGLFDLGVLTFNKSDGTDFVRGDYTLAVGNTGLRLGLNASQLNYKVTQSSLSALQSQGEASTLGLVGQYPLLRSDTLNLSLSANLDQKAMVDKTVAGEIGNKRVNVSNLGLAGMGTDNLWGGGNTGFGLNIIAGDVDLGRNAGALAADQSARQTQGSYQKLAFNLSRRQAAGQSLEINASLTGQVAEKNLDSSERFTLGGPTGIRAYPIGEATGDEGWLAKLIASYTVSKQLTASAFVESGFVKLNKSTWTGWNSTTPNLGNEYGLTGAGLSLDWKISAATLTVVLATPLGSNPGADSQGKDADGQRRDMRCWLSLSAPF
jgi:hemolysin activation/secretion protein